MMNVFTKMSVWCVHVQRCVDGVWYVLRAIMRSNVFSCKVCTRRSACVQMVRAIGPDGSSDVGGRESVAG